MERKRRPDGRLEEKVRDPVTGARKSVYGYSEAELEAEKRRFLGLPAAPSGHTLADYYFDVYLPTVCHRSQNWLNQIAYCMDSYVLPAVGHRPIADVTRAELQAAFNSFKVGASSKRRFRIVLSGVFRLAVQDEAAPRNPCAGVRTPTPAPPAKTALTMPELWRLFESSRGRARALVVLGGFCGLRLGEACGQTRASFASGVVDVRLQALQFSRSKVDAMPPGSYFERRGAAVLTSKLKTPQSVRVVPCHRDALDAIDSSCRALSVYAAPDAHGRWSLPNNAARDLEEAVAAAGVPRVTMHELRHTFMTLLESQLECPASIWQELAGKRVQTHGAEYLHPHMERKRVWAERLWEEASTSSVVRTVVSTA